MFDLYQVLWRSGNQILEKKGLTKHAATQLATSLSLAAKDKYQRVKVARMTPGEIDRWKTFKK